MNPALCTPEAYFADLKQRMQEAGISYRRLALSCEPPLAPSQMHRWMHQHVDPRLTTIGRLEAALQRCRGN